MVTRMIETQELYDEQLRAALFEYTDSVRDSTQRPARFILTKDAILVFTDCPGVSTTYEGGIFDEIFDHPG